MPKKSAMVTANTTVKTAGKKAKTPAKKTKKTVRAARDSTQDQARRLTDLTMFIDILENLESGDSALVVHARAHFNLPTGLERIQLLEEMTRMKNEIESELRGKYGAAPEQRERVMAYQVKITLEHISPPVWRRVLVKSETTLETLHRIIQTVMLWDGGHLHEFEINRLRYGSWDEDFGTDSDYDEAETRLFEVLGQVNAKGQYEYDFGDSWRHEILIEKVLEFDDTVAYPLCVDGRRAGPPDDCGGPWGYSETLEALSNPEHPEHEERLEWFGEGFEPEVFDLEAVNQGLAFLRAKRKG
jgi:Plasmid pRiA4b ORF-3-like protein